MSQGGRRFPPGRALVAWLAALASAAAQAAAEAPDAGLLERERLDDYALEGLEEALGYYERYYDRAPDPALRRWLDAFQASLGRGGSIHG